MLGGAKRGDDKAQRAFIYWYLRGKQVGGLLWILFIQQEKRK